MNTEKCLNNEFLLEQLKISRVGKTSRKDGCVVFRHGRTCSKKRGKILRIGEEQDRATVQSFKNPAWMIITSRKRNLNQLEKCQKVCSQIVLKPGTSWQTGHLVDSKQTCSISHQVDRSWWPTVSSIDSLHFHHTNDHRQDCHVGNTAQHCPLGFIPRLKICWVILRIQHQLRERGSYENLESRTLVPISWMCKKHTSVSHSSTESEIVSLDAGRRVDGLPALDLWDVVTEVFCSSNSTKSPKTKPATGNCLRDPERDRTSEPKQNGNRDVDQLSHVDHVTTNAHSSQGESQFYIFEDNEAVIKIIKGRSPTMRHVSRTHRVALDWLFDSKVQIKYVDTKNQLAEHVYQREFPAWRVEPSSSFVQHHEFLSVFPAAILAIFFLIRSGSSAPCQRDFRKVTWKRDRQWQSRSFWILNLSSMRKVPFHKS